jgi:hypothetical protein
MVNTVVMTAPVRCDLLPSSCVNNEVISFNRQLKKRMAPYNNVKILENGLEREYFTKHGLHLNSSGKRMYCSEISYGGPKFSQQRENVSRQPTMERRHHVL